jgi:hypothetical protein
VVPDCRVSAGATGTRGFDRAALLSIDVGPDLLAVVLLLTGGNGLLARNDRRLVGIVVAFDRGMLGCGSFLLRRVGVGILNISRVLLSGRWTRSVGRRCLLAL